MTRTLEAISKHMGGSTETKSQTMKAIRIHNYGGPEVLKYEDAPRPQPQAGEVVVRVHAAGVNPIDWKVREGYMKDFWPHKFPLILGWDLSGVVEEVGPRPAAAGQFKKGEEGLQPARSNPQRRVCRNTLSFANRKSRRSRTRFITSAQRPCLWLR